MKTPHKKIAAFQKTFLLYHEPIWDVMYLLWNKAIEYIRLCLKIGGSLMDKTTKTYGYPETYE